MRGYLHLLMGLLCLLLLFNTKSLAQRIGAGLSVSAGVESENNNFGLATSLNFMLRPENSHFSFRLTLRPYLSNVNAPYLDHTLFATMYEFAVLVSTKSGVGRPYFGTGVGYVDISLQQNGHPYFYESGQVEIKGEYGSMVFDIFAGVSFNKEKRFEPYIEVSYRMIPINHDLLFVRYDGYLFNKIPQKYTHSEFALNLGFNLNF